MVRVKGYFLRLIWRPAYWLDTFFSGALEARVRLGLARWSLAKVLRLHGEDSAIGSRAQDRAAEFQFAAEYWTDGSEKLRGEIDIALRSGVRRADLRLLSLNRILVAKEGTLAVLSGTSPRTLTSIATAALICLCLVLIIVTLFSAVQTLHKVFLVSSLAAALSYLSHKWRQRQRLLSEARRRVINHLEHRGPVPNVSHLRRRWPHVTYLPTWSPPSTESPTGSEYRNLQPQRRRQRS
jgi:hypothetical protein